MITPFIQMKYKTIFSTLKKWIFITLESFLAVSTLLLSLFSCSRSRVTCSSSRLIASCLQPLNLLRQSLCRPLWRGSDLHELILRSHRTAHSGDARADSLHCCVAGRQERTVLLLCTCHCKFPKPFRRCVA